ELSFPALDPLRDLDRTAFSSFPSYQLQMIAFSTVIVLFALRCDRERLATVISAAELKSRFPEEVNCDRQSNRDLAHIGQEREIRVFLSAPSHRRETHRTCKPPLRRRGERVAHRLLQIDNFPQFKELRKVPTAPITQEAP